MISLRLKFKSFILLPIFIFLSLLFYSDTLWALGDSWKLRIQKEGISVYTRKVENSPILEFKADLRVNLPIGEVISLFEDDQRVKDWYYQCVRFDLIENEGLNRKIYYFVIDLPWPAANRDCVFRRAKAIDSSSKATSYDYVALPDRLPKEKGKIRVPYLKTEWRFTPLRNGETEIYFQQHSAAGGSIPAFLANSLVVDIPFNSLKNFRRLLMKKEG